MTHEEAKREIKECYCEEDFCLVPELATALEMAIEALEKQIAKPVKIYAAHPDPVIMCPVCGSIFVTRDGRMMNCCNNCGQRVTLMGD